MTALLLQGVRAKLARAAKQFHELESLVKAFYASEPYTAVNYYNPQVGELWAEFSEVREPDPDGSWALLIGELVHNLRSGLDHLIWDLVILETGHIPTSNKTQFPIFETEAGFLKDNRGRRCLHGLGPVDQALIKSLQPFSTGENSASPLWHLSELSNWDKHRTIHLTHNITQEQDGLISGPGLYATFVPANGPIEKGTIIGGGMFSMPDDGPLEKTEQMKMEFDYTIAIGFKSPPAVAGLQVLPTLYAIGSRVNAIINKVYEEIVDKAGLASHCAPPATP